MARGLNAAEEKLFKKADKNKSGSLDSREAYQLMFNMGFPPVDEFEGLFENFDKDKSGEVGTL